MLNKYCSRPRRNSKDPDKLPCPSIWTAVKVGFPVFERGICWNVGTNSTQQFWGSKWIKGSCVRDLIEGPLTQQETNLTIANIFQDGRWRWEKISLELPSVVLEKILATPMQLFGEKEYSLVWKFS